MTRSDVWCTNCAARFIAELDLSLNGNHEIVCPHCQHVHYRVVRDGEVTEERWSSSNFGITYTATTYVTTVNVSYSTTTLITSSAWLNRSDLVLS